MECFESEDFGGCTVGMQNAGLDYGVYYLCLPENTILICDMKMLNLQFIITSILTAE